MAKRRTKKERLRSVSKKTVLTKQQLQVKTQEIKTKVVEKKSVAPMFFSQNPKLVKKDLKKTLIVVTVVLLVLFTISLLYT